MYYYYLFLKNTFLNRLKFFFQYCYTIGDSQLKFIYILKIDQKTCFLKSCKKFTKTYGNHVFKKHYLTCLQYIKPSVSYITKFSYICAHTYHNLLFAKTCLWNFILIKTINFRELWRHKAGLQRAEDADVGRRRQSSVRKRSRAHQANCHHPPRPRTHIRLHQRCVFKWF